MSVFSNFQYSFQNDSAFRKKTFFTVGASIFIILLVGAFIFLNFGGGNTTKSTDSSKSTNNKPSSSTPTTQVKQTVTTKNFEDTSSFTRADNEPIGYPNDLLIEKDKLTYITNKYYFRSDQTTNKNSSLFSPAKLLSSPDGVIINESFKSSLVNTKGVISEFPQNNIQISPIVVDPNKPNNISYYFLEYSNDKLQIFESSKIDLSDKKLVTIVKADKKISYQYFEIRKLGSKIFLIAFVNNNKTGDIDFYSIENNKITLQKELTKVESFQYNDNNIIYSDLLPKSTSLTSYRTSIIDFTSPKFETIVLDVSTKLAQDAIYGNILAQRCSINDTDVYCLIKKNQVQSTVFQEPDVIAKINIDTQKITYILQNSVFSASAIHVTKDKTLYFVGQENSNIYKINEVDKV